MATSDVYRRVCELFDAALELKPDARAAFLDAECHDDPAVRREVESLLESFDETPTAEVFPPLLTQDAETLAIGTRVGAYTLRREIGAGGMGVVYEATREDVGKTVALKLVRHGALASPEHLRRFLLERRVLARLEHPSIARLLDAGVTGSGLPFLVMEYVDGEPIDRYCDARRLSVEARLALFAHVCDAVHYAHRHLVVHRDLKPSNIYVAGDGAVKLLDFGIAALLEEQRAGEGRLTRTGALMLTPEYASPEQVRGEPVTTASDVHALGLLLFELLTGQRAFGRASRTTPEILYAVCNEEPVAPSQVARSSPRLARRLAGDLDTIVLKALQKEPDRRYHSVQELRDDVDRHLAGLPVKARGDSIWYRARKFARRHRTAVATSALVILTLAGGVVTTTAQARRAEAERAVAQQRFRDVRALAGALLSDVHDAISDVPGSLPVRATLVSRAVEHLDKLQRQSGDDPALSQEIAAAYVKLGLVQGSPTAANLGDLAAARRSFARALSIAQTLVSANAENRAARRTLALAHEKMSDADAWSDSLAHGVEHARLALAQWQTLAASSPTSVSAHRAVAMSHIKLGDLLGNPNLPNLSDRAGATAEYRRAFAQIRDVPRDSLSDWSTRRLIALVHERLGAMLQLEKHYAEAIAELEQTLAIREGLANERSASVNALRDLAVTHQLLCEAHLDARGDDEALSHCRRGVALYESLRTADPQNVQGLHDLAVGLLSMHSVLAARGELQTSLKQLDRSTELLRRILASHADNIPARRNLARGLLYSSTVHAKLATRPDGADERDAHHRQALSSYERGRQLLLEVSDRRQPSGEDAVLLDQARAELVKVRTKP